jgi:two-component system cell cycle response regulator
VIGTNPTLHVLSIETDLDDELRIRTWLQQAESLEFQVTPVDRLPDVDRVSELDGYDCMLLDMGLPDSRGIEALRSAREIAVQLPIVVFTAAHDDEVAERSMRSGADRLLVKGDFGPDALVNAIVAAVDARRGGIASNTQPAAAGVAILGSGLPMSAQIADGMSGQLAHSSAWNRYRRASGMQF